MIYIITLLVYMIYVYIIVCIHVYYICASLLHAPLESAIKSNGALIEPVFITCYNVFHSLPPRANVFSYLTLFSTKNVHVSYVNKFHSIRFVFILYKKVQTVRALH